MRARGHLTTILAAPGFRRLFAVRLAGQFGDGVFQVSLAGAVLFSPDRQVHASDVAAGFTVLLLPYSLVGPFAGVLLDRWWRQRVLVFSNVCRALVVLLVAAEIAARWSGVLFYATALVVISLSRFFLSALSAALPHVVVEDDLVTANSLSGTVGSIATTLGGASALAVRAAAGSSAGAYAVIATVALAPYLGSAALARRFERDRLGPDEVERGNRETVAAIARGLLDGARHVRARRPALYALSAIAVHRLCFGLWTVTTLLLYRNYFAASGPVRTGLAGLTQVVVAVAIGGGLAALSTPGAARRLGYATWPALLLAGSGVVLPAFGLPYRITLALAGALLLGFASQGIKICVDTIVQVSVDDEFRGRVFALYDTLFNLALVLAAALTALALPETGRTPVTLVLLSAGYLLTAAGYLALARTVTGSVTAVARTSR
ncbi:MFS transporter [Jatrophihabitans cynanchi]|uniref:MFS transporter n=1 Tax=Jatrophihabitans cynanchi TaxID=2944128 RepID=A0ABY7JU77_9ACTN|nr:MFS transporter [Jatrophihabitans sp. SB3-54]WAX55245.1 MFS transporter [Jatrophihabitans sp. SB3-54]